MHSIRKATAPFIVVLLAACGAGTDRTPATADATEAESDRTAASSPTVASTAYLGPFTGDGAQVHPDNLAPHRIAYYGTDLGFTYQHGTQLHFIFGDSWATEAYAPIQASTGARFDDGFGTVDLGEWPNSARITAASVPLIRLGQNPGTTEMSGIDPGHAMDLGKTPMAGFSNGTHEFAIFNLTKPQGCRKHEDCSHGLTCDLTLGYFGSRSSDEENLTLGCREGTPGCVADTLAGAAGAAAPASGFCTDETSVLRGDRVSNLLSSIGLRVRIGLRSPSEPKRYGDTRDWLTNKFMNVTARTVEDFDPAKGARGGNYGAATDSGATRRVFLWGRPGFIGVAANKRSLSLYFAYVDMPAGPGYAWNPSYYAGTVEGVPQFSAHQKDATPVDLDSTRDGVQPDEIIDVVNQMSVAWIEPLRKWVMFYGGGMTKLPTAALPACGILQVFAGSECTDVIIGNGAVRMRSADHPWGPWTPPQDVIVGGAPADGARGQYGPGGALRHPACKEPSCAPHSDMFAYQAEEYGFYYSANLIEQWIDPAGAGVDVVWNASTWDPYRVVLLKTRINK